MSGDAIKEKDDSSFVAMELAARNRTPIDLLVLDGDRTAVAPNQADGWRLTGQILSWVEGQDLADVVKVDFEIKPARSSNNPIAVTGPL